MFVGNFSGRFRVVDGTCTHEGCPVTWNLGQNQFECNCHTARFAADGANISGPPPRPLHRPDFQIQGGNLEILRAVSNEPVEVVSAGMDGIGTSYHEAGTLWLGTDYEKSLTDLNGRLHHITNAYCIDQSIFPTIGSANPVLTGISLSRKFTQSIIDRYMSAEHVALEADFVSLYTGDFASDGWQMVPGGSPNFFDVAEPDHPVLGAGVDNQDAFLGLLRYSRKTFKDFILEIGLEGVRHRCQLGHLLAHAAAGRADDGPFYDSTIEVQIDESGHDGSHEFSAPLCTRQARCTRCSPHACGRRRSSIRAPRVEPPSGTAVRSPCWARASKSRSTACWCPKGNSRVF